MAAKNKTSQINLSVSLNEQRVPEKLEWEAEDNPSGNGQRECKAFLLSIFDKDSLDTMKIDLWTPEMQVIEMDRFFFQTLRAMCDTYYKATNNQDLSNAMHQFVHYFGEETGIIPK